MPHIARWRSSEAGVWYWAAWHSTAACRRGGVPLIACPCVADIRGYWQYIHWRIEP